MAVQNNFILKCDPNTAFECAIKTLQTFKINGQIHINQRFLTVSAALYFYLSCDAIAAEKVLSISVLPMENGLVNIRITGDHLPMKAYNKGNIILTIAEYLDRYSQLLDHLSNSNNT